jgi:hypothetical protein
MERTIAAIMRIMARIILPPVGDVVGGILRNIGRGEGRRK